jgi:hypothetical protein
MANFFYISGYWKDDKSEFENYIVTDVNSLDDDTPVIDDDVFFFNLSEKDIKEAIELKDETEHDFVITSYSNF